ncbi:hypothetical protein JCM10213_005053 [Rhodosporidiobolus nylandii]
MAPTLPIELQLYILDLFIASLPRPTSRNLNQRRQLLEPLTLVHRDWTPKPQQRLRGLLKLKLGAWSPPSSALVRYLHNVRADASSATRCLNLAQEREKFKGVFEAVEELVVQGAKPVPPDLRRLSIQGADEPEFNSIDDLNTLLPTAHLTHLCLDHLWVDWLPFLPQLRTLVIGKYACLLIPVAASFWSFFPNLETLAWDCNDGLPDGLLHDAPSTLRHLWFAPACDLDVKHIIRFFRRGSEPEVALRSLTICLSGIKKPEEEEWVAFKGWCERKGTTFKVLDSMPEGMDTVEDWEP